MYCLLLINSSCDEKDMTLKRNIKVFEKLPFPFFPFSSPLLFFSPVISPPSPLLHPILFSFFPCTLSPPFLIPPPPSFLFSLPTFLPSFLLWICWRQFAFCSPSRLGTHPWVYAGFSLWLPSCLNLPSIGSPGISPPHQEFVIFFFKNIFLVWLEVSP